MRTVYREHLDAFAHDILVMCDSVCAIMDKASDALLRGSLDKAEEALSIADPLEEIRQRCEERSVQLLALENPVASDLRQVISSIYIVEDFDRMAALAMHIANTARRRHPEMAIPEEIRGYVEEMARLVKEMGEKTHDLLVAPDAEVALILSRDDDAVDDLNYFLLNMLTEREWKHSTKAAVDLTLLSRYYERYADHCVNVSGRIVYLITGLMPEQYVEKQESDRAESEMQQRFDDLERQFNRGRGQA